MGAYETTPNKHQYHPDNPHVYQLKKCQKNFIRTGSRIWQEAMQHAAENADEWEQTQIESDLNLDDVRMEGYAYE